MSINIYLATQDYYDMIYSFHKMLFKAHIEKIWGWEESWQKANFSKSWKESRTKVIEYDECFVGFMQTIDMTDCIMLRNIGVHPKFQKKGIGTQVLSELQVEARLLNKPIHLSVFVTNGEARIFYKKIGFVDAKRGNGFQHMKWMI